MVRLIHFVIIACVIGGFTLGYVQAQTKEAPQVTIQDGYTHGNCELLQIKYLQAATQEQDLTQQQVELNAAKAYEELVALGYIC